MFMGFARIVGREFEGEVLRKNILHPLIVMDGGVGLALIALVYAQAAWWLTIVVLVIEIILIAITIFFYFYFAFKDPDRLQSERYQLRKREMEIGNKGGMESRTMDGVIETRETDVIKLGIDNERNSDE